MKKTFLSLFSGAGGLDIGLAEAGWRCRYASDIDPLAVETLNLNLSGHVTGRSRPVIERIDVRDLSGQDLLKKIGASRGDVPLMAGGPPCQSWSSAGHQRGLDDPRGRLFEDFVRLADECDCRFILFENVRGLLTARGPDGEPGGALRLIREVMWKRGYRSSLDLLNAADYGVPQRRVRLYLVGYRDAPAPMFPEPTHARQVDASLLIQHKLPWVPMRSVLLPQELLASDEFIRPSEAMARRLTGLGPGQGVKSPGKRETTRPGGHWGYMQGGFVADPELPARTVTASSQQDWVALADGTFRRLCPRECAMIQSFPPGYRFAGNRSAVYRQVGNAVTPRMGRVMGDLVARMLDGCIDHVGPFDPRDLPRHLEAHVRYTAKEHARNGESRRKAPDRRRVSTRPRQA
ncbi:MAG: DNA cytosine methyltransferase [Planctomycetota bacterium]